MRGENNSVMRYILSWFCTLEKDMSELYHYNHYHDRRGRFTSGPSGIGKIVSNILPKRYMDRDGNLTEAGLKRYKEILDRDRDVGAYDAGEYAKRLDISKSGVVTQNDETYIKKGSTFTRFTDKDEKIDHRRKYVSITDEDRKAYGQVAKEGFLGLKNTDKIREIQYTAVKDLRVAQGKDVSKFLLDKYGDTKVSDMMIAKHGEFSKDDINRFKSGLLSEFGGDDVRSVQADKNKFDLSYDLDVDNYRGKDRKLVESALATANLRDKVLDNFYGEKLMDAPMKNNPTFNHYLKAGYDAIVDVEDEGWAQYPLILLDPATSVKHKKTSPYTEYD